MSGPTGTNWALVAVAAPGGASESAADGPRVGVQRVGSTDVRLPDILRSYRGVLDVVRDWADLAPQLRDLDPDAGELLDDPPLRLPLAYPAKVLCSGPNYRDHLAEMGQAGLGDSWTSYFFFKPPTTALIGPTDPVLVGSGWAGDQVDWEGELAVVLARGGRDIPAEQAMSHVAGYAVANDISLRGPHRRDTPAAPFVWDWVASKAADTSLPLGPGIVPVWQIPDPQQLRIQTRVNGDLRQDGTTADMVIDIASMVADASALLTLEPGDVIVTGTPAGVGASRGTFLSVGDVVDVDIPGVGRLHNRIEQRSAR